MLTGTLVVSDAISYLRWLDIEGCEKAMKKTAKDLDQLLQGLLDDHKRKVDHHKRKVNDQDFVGMMLSILDREIYKYDADTVYIYQASRVV